MRAGDFPPGKQIASEKVFAEDVLQGWGYLTTEVAATYHAIRSSKDYGSGREAFYARFHLAKARFADHADAQNAKNRIETLLLGDAGFKNYTQIIQQDEMLYSVSATSNYTFLEHQPNLLALARAHLATQAEEDGGHKP